MSEEGSTTLKNINSRQINPDEVIKKKDEDEETEQEPS